MSVKMGPYMAADYVLHSLVDDTGEADWLADMMIPS